MLKKFNVIASLILFLTALLVIFTCKAPVQEIPIEKAPPQKIAAEFKVVSLDIAPVKVKGGETATATAKILNTGTEAGNYTAVLTIDGIPVQTKDIAILGGATATVSFTITKEIGGIYKVMLGGLRSDLSVDVGHSRIRSEKPRNIILIGWDGAQRNRVEELLSRGELPNLRKLSSEGTAVAIDIDGATDTKAGWTEILTGYGPSVTGVFNNERYQPIPKGYTIFERLEEFFGQDNFATVAVIGKKEHVDARPPLRELVREGEERKPGEKIAIENGIKYRYLPGEPYYYAKDSMDIFINGLYADKNVGSKTLELLEKYKNKSFFFFVLFAEIDHQGHKYGENSKEYNDAIISADTWTGKIIKKLEELNLYNKTLIYITADHGFDEGMKTHLKAPYVFLGTNDSDVMRRGKRQDIAVTILDRFGLELGKIVPPLSGRPLTKP